MSTDMNKPAELSDKIYILYKWKKFIIWNLFIVSIITVGAVLLLPNNYKATATITLPPESSSGLAGLSNLSGFVGGKSSIASMGAKLLGLGAGSSEDMLMAIINSQSTLRHLIDKYDLVDYYEIDDNNIDKTIKAFRDDISVELNEFQMIDISIIHEDTSICANMANYIVEYVDSVNKSLIIEQARNNRLFIEKRYLQNVADLKNAEENLYAFQSKYGIVAVPEQLEVTVKAAAEVESELIKKEVESHFLKQVYGENSPAYRVVQDELDMLRQKISDIKNSPKLSQSSNIFYPFKKMPEMAIEYLRAYREVEIQQSIMEVVLPFYEQAKVEEQKSMPTIIVIDHAVPPMEKYSPKRSIICVGVFLLFLFLLLPVVFVAERAVTRDKYDNPLQVKVANFFNGIVKFYRIKF